MKKLLPLLAALSALSLLLSACGDGPGDSAAPAPLAVSVAPSTGLELYAGGLGGYGNRDAEGTAARFNQPIGVAVGADGARYVADFQNHTIRKISAAGIVTTLAGRAGTPGTADGSGGAARFRQPGALAVAADGTLYVSDRGNYTLRRITPAGEVTTLAGVAGQAGAIDGDATVARLGDIEGLALATDGTLYFTESGNRLVRKVSPAGVVSTLAGSAGTSGSSDGSGSAARFGQPTGIALGGDGALYVADTLNHTVRRVTTAGVVTTWAGAAGQAGNVDASAGSARFRAPYGVAAAADGTLYVTDSLNYAVRQVAPDRTVTTLAALSDVPDAGMAASIPAGLAVDGDGSLLVADPGAHRLLRVTLAGAVSQAFGAAPLPGGVDAAATAARFNTPSALVTDVDGTVFVADAGGHAIRRIQPDGTVTTLAGKSGTVGSADGTGAAARFNSPSGIALDASGNLYVADTGNHVIRRVTPSGVVSVFAGQAGAAGATDATGTAARFSSPRGLAFDPGGNLLVADTGNHVLRRITPAGVVTTLAGLAGLNGAFDASGINARFNAPWAVAVAPDGTAYVSDQLNRTIRRVTPAGAVTTLAGSAGAAGDDDGTGAAARFRAPAGLGTDADGNVYVADRDGHTVRRITPAGAVTTLLGSAGVSGALPGPLPGGLNLPLGLALGPAGQLYVTSEHAVLKATFDPALPVFGVILTADSTALVIGDTLTLRWAARDAVDCRASDAWSAVLATSGSLSLVPARTGTFRYTLTCRKAGSADLRSASVDVTVSPAAPGLAFSASSAYVNPGSELTLTWSGSNVTSCTAYGDWDGDRGTSGSYTFVPSAGSRTYTLSCAGEGGVVIQNVYVAVAPPPVVSLTASSATPVAGQPLTLTWTTSNATACIASGAWAGSRATSGSQVVTPAVAASLTYLLSCSGAGGTTTGTLAVTVSAAPPAASGGSGGGGGSWDLTGLAVLALLAARRRRARGGARDR